MPGPVSGGFYCERLTGDTSGKENAVRTLIIVIIVAVAGYYLYQAVFDGGGEEPSCKQIYASCSTKCRQGETEMDPYNACLKKCEAALEICR